jgi:methionyl-tRNA formyltransferase
MTDLPFGRGGSPLQNLIVRNFKKTKISAIRVEKGVDTGPVYLKKDLDLGGTASEIFQRSSDIIYNMITQIIDNKIIPKPQKGRILKFKRRTPEQSNIFLLDDLSKVYDYIRMLDCDGYPKAFIESNKLKFEFSNTKITSNNELKANVRIFKK